MSNVEIIVAGETDIGRKRNVNQDGFICFQPQVSPLSGYALISVADGMGGPAGGEIASVCALDAVHDCLKETDPNSSKNELDIGKMLVESAIKANRNVRQRVDKDKSLKGMGTTLTAALLNSKKLVVVNVGDSRGYLITKSAIKQITKDHSWVSEQVEDGLLTDQEARNHPRRNIITRAIGIADTVKVDLFSERLSQEDIVVLCSDGLYPLVSDKEIFNAFKTYHIEEACSILVRLSNDRGGPDNITVTAAYVTKSKSRSSETGNYGDGTLDQDKTQLSKTKANIFKSLMKSILFFKR